MSINVLMFLILIFIILTWIELKVHFERNKSGPHMMVMRCVVIMLVFRRWSPGSHFKCAAVGLIHEATLNWVHGFAKTCGDFRPGTWNDPCISWKHGSLGFIKKLVPFLESAYLRWSNKQIWHGGSARWLYWGINFGGFRRAECSKSTWTQRQWGGFLKKRSMFRFPVTCLQAKELIMLRRAAWNWLGTSRGDNRSVTAPVAENIGKTKEEVFQNASIMQGWKKRDFRNQWW